MEICPWYLVLARNHVLQLRFFQDKKSIKVHFDLRLAGISRDIREWLLETPIGWFSTFENNRITYGRYCELPHEEYTMHIVLFNENIYASKTPHGAVICLDNDGVCVSQGLEKRVLYFFDITDHDAYQCSSYIGDLIDDSQYTIQVGHGRGDVPVFQSAIADQ